MYYLVKCADLNFKYNRTLLPIYQYRYSRLYTHIYLSIFVYFSLFVQFRVLFVHLANQVYRIHINNTITITINTYILYIYIGIDKNFIYR